MAKDKNESQPVTFRKYSRPSGNHTFSGVTGTAQTLFEMNRRDKLCARWGITAGRRESTRAAQ